MDTEDYYKKIRDRIQKSKPVRKNSTFHLDERLTKEFRATCPKVRLRTVEVLETMMRDFLDGLHKVERTKK